MRIPVFKIKTLAIIKYKLLTMLLCFCGIVYADITFELPGEELTQERLDRSRAVQRISIPPAAERVRVTESSDPSETNDWLEEVMKTWNAPPLHVQFAANRAILPFGKGGIFIPKMSEINSEPDIEIVDKRGRTVSSGESGRTHVLEPGEYTVMLGSGSQRQRIVKEITVEEGKTSTLTPDWSGLIIEVVDEHGSILRGEYELVRIDEFDPYGRGYGASIEIGETVRAWILKPGTYKILGAGAGYNTLTNFVTVRLLPGEMTNFLLIQDSLNFHIRGGGTVHMTPTTRLTSSWRVGANIGANLQFNAEHDHEAKTEENAFSMGLLFDSYLLYRKSPVEWSTRLRLEESINIENNEIENMINTPDRVNMSSIFIWRLYDWMGPYARAEFGTKLFGTKLRRSKESYFCFVNADYEFNEETGVNGFDTSLTFVSEPAFSPLILDLGLGLNIDLTSKRTFESRLRVGVGSSYSRYLDRYRVIESDKVIYLTDDSLTLAQQQLRAANSIILYPDDKVNIFETGPQIALSLMSRLGAFASADAEIRVFTPVVPEVRITKPDLDLHGTLSWRLSSVMNLDYTYRRSLKQPTELEVPVHTSAHGIWLRLHFSSR